MILASHMPLLLVSMFPQVSTPPSAKAGATVIQICDATRYQQTKPMRQRADLRPHTQREYIKAYHDSCDPSFIEELADEMRLAEEGSEDWPLVKFLYECHVRILQLALIYEPPEAEASLKEKLDKSQGYLEMLQSTESSPDWSYVDPTVDHPDNSWRDDQIKCRRAAIIAGSTSGALFAGGFASWAAFAAKANREEAEPLDPYDNPEERDAKEQAKRRDVAAWRARATGTLAAGIVAGGVATVVTTAFIALARKYRRCNEAQVQGRCTFRLNKKASIDMPSPGTLAIYF